MTRNIKNLILIASGKGGVGKSTVSTNIALALADRGFKTGLLDADIYGPSIPTMIGTDARPASVEGKSIAPLEKYGLKLMSMGYMVDPNVAMVWRGPMLAGAVTQFVQDVEWGELDYLIFDLPPGTGDIQLSLAQKVQVTGSLLVTTPQDVALADVYRAKAMFDKVRIPILGLVENMSYFVADDGKKYDIFGTGGGEKASRDLELPLMGQIPIEPRVRECGDQGEPIVRAYPDADSAVAFRDIADRLHEAVEKANEERSRAESGRGSLKIITN